LTYLGFVTEGKLAAIFIKPFLGVSNWPVIYFINYTPTSFLAPFITAPPMGNAALQEQYPSLYNIVCHKSDAIATVMATSPLDVTL
jgi:hypothetical protein